MVSRRGFLHWISAFSISDLVRPGIDAEAIPAKAPSELAQEQPNGAPAGRPQLECGNSLVRVRISGSSSDFWSLENRASGQDLSFWMPGLSPRRESRSGDPGGMCEPAVRLRG